MKKILVSLSILAAALGSFAQNTDPTQTDSLEQIVISANRTAEQKRDIPQQIEVISARQIQKISPLTTADALQNSGAVFVQKSQQGGGSPVLRGFEANKVLLVVDGVRMNNAIFRGGHLQNSITTDPAMMERIEVLHGAGSVIYGTDAIGGVISFFTKKPKLSFSEKREVKLGGFTRYSSANQGVTASVNVNVGHQKWASLTALTANWFGDLRSGERDLKDYPGFGDRNWYVQRVGGVDSIFKNPNPDLQVGSGYRQLDFLQKFLFVPGEKTRHTLNLQGSTSSNVPRYDRLTQTRPNGSPRFGDWYYGPQHRLLASYEFSRELGSQLADLVRFTPAFQKVQESRNDRALGSSVINRRVENLDIFSANLDFFKEKNGHEIRYGAEFFHNKLDSEGNAEDILTGKKTPISARYPDGTYSTTGVYVSHRWEMQGKKLILSDGLRFSSVWLRTHYDRQFFETTLRDVRQNSNSLNWNLGLVGLLPAGFRASAVASTGFRNPNIDDLEKTFEANNPGQLIVPNQDLRPEQVTYFELGLGKKFGTRAELNFNLFRSELREAIAVRPFQLNGMDSVDFEGVRYQTVANVNAGKARVQGFSVEGRWQLMPALTLRGNLALTKGRDRTNNVPLDHIPPLFGSASASWERGRLRAECVLLFNGWKRLKDYSPSGEDNLNFATPDGTPAWQTWNLRAGWQFAPRWRAQAAVENLLDLNYRVFASGINAPGRTFVLSVHFQ